MDKPLIDIILEGARHHDTATVIVIFAAGWGWLVGVIGGLFSEKRK